MVIYVSFSTTALAFSSEENVSLFPEIVLYEIIDFSDRNDKSLRYTRTCVISSNNFQITSTEECDVK